MPHIRLSKPSPLPLSLQKDGVAFLWVARNMMYANEALIGVEVEGVSFLLLYKEEEETVLIKAEKITRPSPNTLIKRALRTYLDAYNIKPLFSNIDTLRRPLHKPPSFFKEMATFDPSILPDKRVWIEIGFGSGRHLLHWAQAREDIHMIGIEIHRPSIEQVMRRVDLLGLKNVWLIDYDARLFMECLPSNRIERIFLHFPIPWDKKPHRRVLSPLFLKEVSRVLSQGGFLELRTDSPSYFHYAMELFLAPHCVQMQVEKNTEAAVRSKYEDRWRRLEKEIYQVRWSALEESPPRQRVYDFSFSCKGTIDSLYQRRMKTSIVQEDYFIHLERFYAIDKTRGMIRLSMGSFDRPEHLYLFVDRQGIHYFPREPIPTEANQKAHQRLRAWLCGAS